jgi:hypothetical protein
MTDGGRLRRAIDTLVYASVLLGAIFLPQVYYLLPSFVFYGLLAGWLAYIGAAICVARGIRAAYPLVVVLAILTLAVSLPQPEHYTLLNPAQALAGATFLLGSAMQVCLIVLIPVHYFRRRRRSESVEAG